MNDIQWDKIILEDFRSLACLSEEEEIVLRDWANDKSPDYTSMRRHISVRQVERIRNKLRKKYDAVQPYTPLLPKRSKEK